MREGATIADVLEGRADWVVVTGDCLSVLPTIPAGSVGAVVTDPPYGTTQAEWDRAVSEWWEYAYSILYEDGAVVVTSCGMFTADTMIAQRQRYRYKWVWCRGGKVTGFLDAKTRPMRSHEDVLVFGSRMPRYFPQMGRGPLVKASASRGVNRLYGDKANNQPYESRERYPRDVLEFNADDSRIREHPTQKPVSLVEYLVLTYSAACDVVLDPFAGSGTTGVAAIRTGRRAILIEKDEGYAAIARRRIREAEPVLFTQAAKPEQLTLGGEP